MSRAARVQHLQSHAPADFRECFGIVRFSNVRNNAISETQQKWSNKMAKKAAGKQAEEVVYKNDGAAMTAILKDMIANPKEYRPLTLKDSLEPLWPLIQQTLAAGVPASSIAAKLRSEEQLDVSEAAFRKFVADKLPKTDKAIEKEKADAATKAAAGKPKA
ncbi:hypothetical protein [Janthinobacterium sp. PAMC25594]|uniref:hypothetical protein n=1 Tax=Janthinobacterium sp. PAMC25594 TaxID=2861284 RepID=UPI001C62F0D1|nr:hypothetical protein [Janthinobacterium sp. PAMC25594]QYG06255.1 hypothetical protein KY494_23770 [Janthinobacterium sp. PAMC25594]